ncbi:MAG: hypothetical protein IPF82_16345 [Blastocatellia bacterium]|nr:hypothetical protein [Blastocatellia bacterium]
MKPLTSSTTFALDKAEFRREDHGIETHTAVSVSTGTMPKSVAYGS